MNPIQPYQQGLPTNQQGMALQAMLAGRDANVAMRGFRTRKET